MPAISRAPIRVSFCCSRSIIFAIMIMLNSVSTTSAFRGARLVRHARNSAAKEIRPVTFERRNGWTAPSALFGSSVDGDRATATRAAVQGLMGGMINRASSTLGRKDAAVVEATEIRVEAAPSSDLQRTQGPSVESSVHDLIQTAASRAQSTLDSKGTFEDAPAAASTPSLAAAEPTQVSYRGNPAIANTALAHVLWQSVLRPGLDTAIDATCGNGHDSLALAQMLFDATPAQSRLLCIDVQQQACDATVQTLRDGGIDESLLQNGQIEVVCMSHSPLPPVSQVALVVYNLGFLPQSDSKTRVLTQMDTTIESIVDALLLVRVGGMISAMTYPKTNPEEDRAVRILLECAALLSSNIQTWQGFLLEECKAGRCSDAVQQRIVDGMERLVEDGSPKQTWRVSEHHKKGMDRAPILVTATRIK